jgi:hypothetical protein
MSGGDELMFSGFSLADSIFIVIRRLPETLRFLILMDHRLP